MTDIRPLFRLRTLLPTWVFVGLQTIVDLVAAAAALIALFELVLVAAPYDVALAALPIGPGVLAAVALCGLLLRTALEVLLHGSHPADR